MRSRLTAIQHALASLGILPGSGSSGSSASLFHQASRVLVHADILAWEGSTYTMAGQPGSGRLIVPLIGSLAGNGIGAHPYGDVQTDAFIGLYADGGVGGGGSMMDLCINDGGSGLTYTTNFLTQGGGQPGEDSIGANTTPFGNTPVPTLGLGTLMSALAQSAFVNRSMVLTFYNHATPLSGGHIDNTISAGVVFVVFRLADGHFLTTDESGWNATSRTFSA